jgi:hypothetical protein
MFIFYLQNNNASYANVETGDWLRTESTGIGPALSLTFRIYHGSFKHVKAEASHLLPSSPPSDTPLVFSNRVVVYVKGMMLYLWTATSNEPIVHTTDDTWVWTDTVGWYWQRKAEELGEKPVPLPVCLSQTRMDCLGSEPAS